MKFLVIFAVLSLFEGFEPVKMKQHRWQRASKLSSIIRGSPETLGGYWLSSDPNHFCADLNFDCIVDFRDYSWYLRTFWDEVQLVGLVPWGRDTSYLLVIDATYRGVENSDCVWAVIDSKDWKPP